MKAQKNQVYARPRHQRNNTKYIEYKKYKIIHPHLHTSKIYPYILFYFSFSDIYILAQLGKASVCFTNTVVIN